MYDPRRARLRDEEDRELYAIRREERELARVEGELEEGLAAFEHDERESEVEIEREWRREGWGHDPERPPEWPDDGDR